MAAAGVLGLALALCIAGPVLAVSAAGRRRGQVVGATIVFGAVGFAVNFVAEAWSTVSSLRFVSPFHYYAPADAWSAARSRSAPWRCSWVWRRITAEAGDDGPRILILTTFDLDEHVYDALSAGASGFLLKAMTADRLFEAVRVVAAGEALLAPTVTRRLIAELARLRPRPSPRAASPEALTPRETEVLRLIAEGARENPVDRSQRPH